LTTAPPLRLTDLEPGLDGRAERIFASLRHEPGMSRCIEPRNPWGITSVATAYNVVRYADLLEASRRVDLFSSARGTLAADLPEPYIEALGSIINMDPPRHNTFRKRVSWAFSRKAVGRFEVLVEQTLRELLARLREMQEFDFVEAFAAPLPARITCKLLGMSPEFAPELVRCTNIVLGFSDPAFVAQGDPAGIAASVLAAAADLYAHGEDVATARRRCPQDDLLSSLVASEGDGGALSPAEVGALFVLLAVAGAETTKNALAHAIWLFTANPDQLDVLRADPGHGLAPAVDEVLRLASPIRHFRRTVTVAGNYFGERLTEGDKLLLWYCSANRDEQVFRHGGNFRISETSCRHVAFGAPGPHFCLGAHLARRQLASAFKALFISDFRLEVVSEPVFTKSAFISGIRSLPVKLRPTQKGR
jgi:methyl-branched lipid omega-hydroxylase